MHEYDRILEHKVNNTPTFKNEHFHTKNDNIYDINVKQVDEEYVTSSIPKWRTGSANDVFQKPSKYFEYINRKSSKQIENTDKRRKIEQKMSTLSRIFPNSPERSQSTMPDSVENYRSNFILRPNRTMMLYKECDLY